MSINTDFEMMTDAEIDEAERALAAASAGETDHDRRSVHDPDPEPMAPAVAPTVEDAAPAVAPEAAPTPETPKPQTSEYMALRQRAQAAEAEAKRLRDEKAVSDQRATLQKEYERILDAEGPEAARAFADRTQTVAQTEARVRQETAAAATRERIAMSADLARDHYTPARFDAALGRLVAEFGGDWVDKQAAAQPNPGKWVVEFHDTKLAPSAETQAASIKAEVDKQLTAAIAKLNPPPTRAGSSGVTHLSSASDVSLEGMDPDDMTDAQLEAFEKQERKTRRG